MSTISMSISPSTPPWGVLTATRLRESSRYFKVASNEPAEGPGSIADARSIVTSNEYLVFSRDYSIPSFAPGPPGKRNRHYAVSRPVKEARSELFRTDPREFYLENSAVLYAPAGCKACGVGPRGKPGYCEVKLGNSGKPWPSVRPKDRVASGTGNNKTGSPGRETLQHPRVEPPGRVQSGPRLFFVRQT